MHRGGGIAAIALLAAVGLSACGGQTQQAGASTDCATVKTIDANLAPVQQDLRASALSPGDARQITAQQVADYRKMSTIVSDETGKMSDAAMRDKARSLAQAYTTIADAISTESTAAASGTQAQDLLGKLTSATAALHAQCGSGSAAN